MITFLDHRDIEYVLLVSLGILMLLMVSAQ